MRSAIRRNVMAAPLAALLALSGATITGTVACKSTQPVGEQVDDSAITAKVKTGLTAGKPKAHNINVTTNEGVVTLTGRVGSSDEKADAERIARGVSHVKDVNNLLEVGDRTP